MSGIRKRISIIICIAIIFSCVAFAFSGCTFAYLYYHEDGIWVSEDESIKLDCRFKKGTIKIDGKVYQVSLGMADDASYMQIYDLSGTINSLPFDKRLIWKADTVAKKGEGTLKLTVTDDRVSNCVGNTYELKFVPASEYDSAVAKQGGVWETEDKKISIDFDNRICKVQYGEDFYEEYIDIGSDGSYIYTWGMVTDKQNEFTKLFKGDISEENGEVFITFSVTSNIVPDLQGKTLKLNRVEQ